MTLAELSLNQKALISNIPSEPTLIAKLLEHGLVPQTQVSLKHKAPFNGPVAVALHGTKMALPVSLAKQIQVELV